LGAALAYYTVFSLAPLLIIAIAIAGLAFGQEAAQGQIFDQLRSLLGEASGKAMQDMVQNANAKPATGLVATLIGVVTHRNEVVCPIILREEERKEAAIVSVLRVLRKVEYYARQNWRVPDHDTSDECARRRSRSLLRRPRGTASRLTPRPALAGVRETISLAFSTSATYRTIKSAAADI
jgi:hypothetical protein